MPVDDLRPTTSVEALASSVTHRTMLRYAARDNLAGPPFFDPRAMRARGMDVVPATVGVGGGRWARAPERAKRGTPTTYRRISTVVDDTWTLPSLGRTRTVNVTRECLRCRR